LKPNKNWEQPVYRGTQLLKALHSAAQKSWDAMTNPEKNGAQLAEIQIIPSMSLEIVPQQCSRDIKAKFLGSWPTARSSESAFDSRQFTSCNGEASDPPHAVSFNKGRGGAGSLRDANFAAEERIGRLETQT